MDKISQWMIGHRNRIAAPVLEALHQLIRVLNRYGESVVGNLLPYCRNATSQSVSWL